jgi:hypothetical protein
MSAVWFPNINKTLLCVAVSNFSLPLRCLVMQRTFWNSAENTINLPNIKAEKSFVYHLIIGKTALFEP